MKEELIVISSALISSLKVVWAFIIRESVNKSPITVSPAIDKLPGMFIPAELDISLFFIIILAVFLYLLFSLYKVVVLKGPRFRSEAMATYVKKRKIEATRGNIYSDDGSLLSTTLPR